MLRLKAYPIIFLTAALIYVITAYNSHGYFDTDEHFQTIELAGLKLGTHGADDLPREYKEGLRSSFLPGICFVVIKGISLFSISDPYSQAFILRILTAFLALFTIHFFIKQTEHFFNSNQLKTTYYLLSYFLWFIPFVSVRFSSETWSGLLFLLSMSVCLQKKENPLNWYLFGILLGFSFLCRYQMGFAIACLVGWLWFMQKTKPPNLAKTAAGFTLVFVLGLLLDAWYYEKFTITLVNYLQLHIDTRGQAYGTSPWYFYAYKLLQYPSFFIGIPLVASFTILIIKRPKNLYLWCILPFILIHTMIPHKEERFLIPMVFLFPIVLLLGYEELLKMIKTKAYKVVVKWLLIVVFLIANPIGLLVLGTKAAGIGRMEITKYIHENYKDKNIHLICTPYANPYDPYHYLPSLFYQETNMVDVKINSICNLSDSLIINDAYNLLIIRKRHLNDTSCVNTMRKYGFELKKQSIPNWVISLNRFYRGLREEDIFLLYDRSGATYIEGLQD